MRDRLHTVGVALLELSKIRAEMEADYQVAVRAAYGYQHEVESE
jgi:hypothetical protein